MKNVSISKTKERIDFLKREIGEEYLVIKEEEIEIISTSETEIFDVGYALGKEENREKPESFHLQNKYAEILKKAISDYQRESYIHVDSVKIELQGEVSEVTVFPTQYVHWFNIASRYGKLCEENLSVS